MSSWWQHKATRLFGSDAGFKLPATGQEDYEKGNIYNAPVGSDVSLPEKTRVVWADSQHAVLEDSAGNFLNLLHVNTYANVGETIDANTPFARVSGLVGTTTDPTSGGTYTAYPGQGQGIIEFGVYDTARRAEARDNASATDFTGIMAPDKLITAWNAGATVPNLFGGSGASLGEATMAGGGGATFLEANPLSLLQSIPLVGTFMQPWLLIVIVLLVVVVLHAK